MVSDIATVMVSLSIIIPLAPEEEKPNALIATLPQEAEVILSQEGGRAVSLNHGAKRANGEYLLFLHADSKLPMDGLERLQKEISDKPEALHYFDLAFTGGLWAMKLNAWGANFRSRILGCPFGDQGLCIHKKLFETLGGYPEGASYGEDHLFVWKARKAGIKLNPINATLFTSSRKYVKHGWFKVTLMHQYLWAKQASEQLWK